MPQDLYKLQTSSDPNKSFDDQATAALPRPFLCYSQIPERPIPFQSPEFKLQVPPPRSPYAPGYPTRINLADLNQDLDALAAGSYPQFERFSRIKVNATTPLAAWLQDVSTTISSSSLVSESVEEHESMPAGQMTYIFTIQITAGLDVKTTWTATLWPIVGAEVNGNMQQTSTLTLVINGVESADAAGTKTGSTVRVIDKSKEATKMLTAYTPRPEIVPTMPIVIGHTNKNVHELTTKLSVPIYARPAQTFARPGIARGTVVNPVPLSPLGAPNF
jgi:hypothetical protein